MGIIIDTNVFINAENGRLDFNGFASYEHYGDGYISAITMSELLAGVHLAPSASVRVKRSAFVESIVNAIPVLALNDAAARVYAELYSRFIKPRTKREGRVHDLQIAATAIAYGYPVLTSNKADFKNIPGLAIECLP